jgi:secondary thiamine-phosphate synthase enzyme
MKAGGRFLGGGIMPCMTVIRIKTTKKREIVDITDTVQNVLQEAHGKASRLVNLFVMHTTAALTTADLDAGGTDQDYLDAFTNLVPKFSPSGVEGIQYRHPHDPAHMPDHILSTLIGVSLTLPVADGQLALGTWQRVVLIELDGPRERRIIVST